ncbi:MAG: hypothetical protein WCJ35_15685 [Planctomycetota bacterium]
MNHRITYFSVTCVALLLFPMVACAWEPNAKDLDDAIGSGDFGTYSTNVTKWLNQKTPATVTEDSLKLLLKDAVFVHTLDQYQFISKCGADKLGAFAKADKGNQAFLTWLMKDTRVMDLYLEAGGVPSGDGCIPTLKFWCKVFHADPDSKGGICLKIAIATAIMHPVPFTDERTPRITQPYEGRYLYYKKAHQDGDLLPSFDHLSVWECQKVVEGMGAPPEDLTWVRQLVRTWRPDLIKDNRIVKIVSEVRYGHSPIPIVDMASVLDAGGICGRRSYFGRKTCAAFGIPAIGILQPRHAALACKTGDTWQVEYGASWWASTCEGGPDGEEFVAEAVARSHAAEFSQSEHLKWLASALTAKDTAKAITAVAVKLVPRSTDPKAMVHDSDTKSEMEANGVSKTTSATKSSLVPQEVSRVDAGTLHINADNFDKMANVMVYDSYPDGTGKQVNFQKNLDASWVDYTLDAPKAGIYSLVLKLAAPNRNQVLNVTVGTGSVAAIHVPNTRGLWGMTSAIDIKLEKGKQTFRIAAPLQRGIAVKWIELKQK